MRSLALHLALLAFFKASVEGQVATDCSPAPWPYPQCTEPLTAEETPDRANPIAPGTFVEGTNGPSPGAMTLEHEAWSTPDSRFDYTWPSPGERSAAIANGTFIDYNVNIAGIKEYGGRYFMTTPRWKAGVPATIVEYIPKGSDHPEASPDKELFKPWPSWHWNRYSDGTPEDCKTTIQYSHGLFIDGTRLWALDIGAKDLFTATSAYVCPPKIMAFDMAECDANPECEPVLYYEFPNECARHLSADSQGVHQFLNDLFVDPLTDWVYISDAMFTAQNDGLPGSEYTGGMIGLNIELGICNRLESMETDIIQEAPEGSQFSLNGINFALSQAADGVALDPIDGKQVIFSSIGAYTKWSIPAHALRDPTMTNDERAAAVSRMFIKDDQSDGISVDPQGNLWVGGMQSSSIRRYNRDEWGYYDPSPDIIFSDCALGHWFDSFGEAPGKMLSASNEIMLFFCEIGDAPCPPGDERSFTFRIFSAPVEGGTAMDTILAQKDTWTEGWPDYAALASTSGSTTLRFPKMLAVALLALAGMLF